MSAADRAREHPSILANKASKAVKLARELGAEHGREAGEAWCSEDFSPEARTHAEAMLDVGHGYAVATLGLPEPDLNGMHGKFDVHDLAVVVGVYGDQDHSDWNNIADAYCDAFRAAVDETVRGKVGS